MNLKEKLLNHDAKVSVIGLGYVGMPLSVEFAKYTNVIGFDINKDKIWYVNSILDSFYRVLSYTPSASYNLGHHVV
ncbi:UDP-N-acetyl-D-galactosamine dehydrogenase [Aliicoccus persicus]|uniref:UDP-N-acetyl-D-galactosamine dehydrogenase n=1 Tax=Aliicoccus persicus TaxID=930138 RepID=A0A662YZY4_9STAP|nr:UDP-N-acetyl-D-galactosamine dehydrogenase [Aliicoccus persicus]